jgi:hypothetical protein
MPKDPIDQLIEAKEAKIAAAERVIGKLKIEIATLHEAREAIAETTTALSQPGAMEAAIAAEPRKGRSISSQWKQVLVDIAHVGADGVDLDNLLVLCERHNIHLKRPTLRAQMSNYVKRGYLGRTGEGKFVIAIHGLTVAGLQGPPQVSGESRKETGTPAQTGAPEKWR